KGDSLAVGEAPATVPVHVVADAVDVLVELPAQARLADPSRSEDRHQSRSLLLQRCVEELLHEPEFAVTPGEGCLEPVDTAKAADGSDHLSGDEQWKRLGLAFELVRAH